MHMRAPQTRVLMVDDEPLARERLRTLLQDEPGFEIVGEAGDGTTGAESIMALRPTWCSSTCRCPAPTGST